MAWKINQPFTLSTSVNVEIPPVFDGKNVWFATSSGLICVEYWGPYSNDSIFDNSVFVRWNESDIDMITEKSIGPRLSIHKTVTCSEPLWITYFNGYVYVMSDEFKKINCTTGEVVDIPLIGTIESIGSNFVVYDNLIYFTDRCPITQDINDNQKLYSLNLTTGILTMVSIIPGRKQAEFKRSLVICNNYLYISAYTNRAVIKFNASTGSYISTIIVNRDVETLYRVDNNVVAISSMKGKTTIDSDTFITSMVSQIDPTDTVTALYGILNAGSAFTDAGDYVWFVNDNKGIQRTKKSNNQTFLSVDTSQAEANTDGTPPTVQLEMLQTAGVDTPGITSDDKYAVNLKVTNPSNMPITNNLASPIVSKITSKGASPSLAGDYAISNKTDFGDKPIIADIKNIFSTPLLSYQYLNGGSWVTVNVPRFLFLIKDAEIILVKLPSALKWDVDFKLNQYAAVSTGGLGYKQG